MSFDASGHSFSSGRIASMSCSGSVNFIDLLEWDERTFAGRKEIMNLFLWSYNCHKK